jgi:hypothetical protein
MYYDTDFLIDHFCNLRENKALISLIRVVHIIYRQIIVIM